jgi:deoxycytidine triphosphate deaminase
LLSDDQIREAVTKGAVCISYAFLPDADGVFRQRRATLSAASDPDAREFFESCLTRSRIALTLGPLIKPLSRSHRIPHGERFGGRHDIVDLRQCPRGYTLLPGQSAVVFANEHVKLGSEYVALILGRVSSYSSGLITTASYVDSTWDGLVELHLMNTSKRPVRLHLGTEIGRLFLFQSLEGSLDGASVSRQGLHYGFTWARILAGELDPFLQGPVGRARSLTPPVHVLNDLVQRYAGLGLLALLVLAVGTGARLYTKVSDALDIKPTVKAHDTSIAVLRQHAPMTGTESVAVGANQQMAQVEVKLGTVAYNGAASYAATSLRENSAQANAYPTVVSRNGGVFLIVTVKPDAATNAPRMFDVNWIYVP